MKISQNKNTICILHCVRIWLTTFSPSKFGHPPVCVNLNIFIFLTCLNIIYFIKIKILKTCKIIWSEHAISQSKCFYPLPSHGYLQPRAIQLTNKIGGILKYCNYHIWTKPSSSKFSKSAMLMLQTAIKYQHPISNLNWFGSKWWGLSNLSLLFNLAAFSFSNAISWSSGNLHVIFKRSIF